MVKEIYLSHPVRDANLLEMGDYRVRQDLVDVVNKQTSLMSSFLQLPSTLEIIGFFKFHHDMETPVSH